MKFPRAAVSGVLLTLVSGVGALAATFGGGVTSQEVTKVSAVVDNPSRYAGKVVVVEGTVVDVCAARGCWLELAGDKPHQKLRVTVDDGVIVFPMESRGKKARVQGTVEEFKLSKEEALEQAKHHARETGRAFDPKTVTGPATLLQLRATGAVIP